MSFILDALKKSETDRQRQSGPALFEVRVAPPRDGLTLWAVGLAVLLAVNLVIVAWVLLRRPPAPAEAVAAAPPAPTTATAPVMAQQTQTVAPASTTALPPGGTAPAPPQAQTTVMNQPGPAGTPPAASAPGGASYAQQPLAGNTASTAPADQPDTAGEKLNPDDYAPATEPAPTPGFGNHVARTTADGVPLYQDAALAPGAHLPDLRLDLHVFAAKPQERFVMINMHKLREGDSLPEGVRVESIVPEGAVLSHNGTKFLLPRD